MVNGGDPFCLTALWSLRLNGTAVTAAMQTTTTTTRGLGVRSGARTASISRGSVQIPATPQKYAAPFATRVSAGTATRAGTSTLRARAPHDQP